MSQQVSKTTGGGIVIQHSAHAGLSHFRCEVDGEGNVQYIVLADSMRDWVRVELIWRPKVGWIGTKREILNFGERLTSPVDVSPSIELLDRDFVALNDRYMKAELGIDIAPMLQMLQTKAAGP